jgi:hypothetical protein
MRANDLRLGNLIYWNILEKKDTIHTVVGIRNEKPQTIPISLGESIEDYKPIPLTEIWLEKLGLIKKNITEGMPQELKQPDIDEDGSIWYNWVQGLFNLEIQSNGEIWFELYSHYKHIKYVHELQNLYYSLTGVELSVS